MDKCFFLLFQYCQNRPVYPDVNTPTGYLDDFQALGDDGEGKSLAKPGFIYMDAMEFGMGMSCLQVDSIVH